MGFRLWIDGTTFRDEKSREVVLHGINVAGDAKLPRYPDLPSHERQNFFDGDNVSFIDRPFDVSQADTHFERLKRWGYNTIRYIFTWEALEAAGPGKYDEEFIQHTISILRVAKKFKFYVFMDPHQDAWSRFTGGSGAPMWTLYACGLNPETFLVTEAALVQNTWPVPEEYPKMIWATNYTRLAAQTMFTLFFAGKHFAPNAIIDDINIQDYLQNHYVNACRHLAEKIREAGDLEDQVVIGWESWNEPNRGHVGYQDITVVPSGQKLQLGTSPTVWQSILTGSGRSCEVETWAFGGLGPYKSGSQLVNPQGTKAWLPQGYDDSRYGWKRDPQWKLGECIWAQHGVWDPKTDSLLDKSYFARHPQTGEKIDYAYFTNHYWLAHFRKYAAAIKDVFPETIFFAQPPTLELPPVLKGGGEDDKNIVYAPHWYDGVTLMTKKWNRWWNVDVFGVLRGRYWAPAFAIKIGETAIRNCFRDSLAAIKKEGLDYMGVHPCVFTELGIPYDMDNEYAYKTGDYSSQKSAMDANHYALEGSKSDFTLWTYTACNTHRRGDHWDGEDLSIFSKDDEPLPNISSLTRTDSSLSSDPVSPSFSRSYSSNSAGAPPMPSSNEQTMSKSSFERQRLIKDSSDDQRKNASFRAGEAYVRPYPTCTNGSVISYSFDLKNCEFKLSLSASSSSSDTTPTEIFLPEFHFPRESVQIETSGEKWNIIHEDEDEDSTEFPQILKWWHSAGEQNIKIKGPVRKNTSSASLGRDWSYLNWCKEKACVLM